jgi:acyl-coenzyme A synthetase/AMP-(fatty) acid ligase
MTSSKGHELANAGFQHILDDIVDRRQRGGALRDAVEDIVTLGNRIDPAPGREMLTAAQAALLELAAEQLLQPAVPPDRAPPAGGTRYFVGVWSYGRIWLSDVAPNDPECRLIGSIVVPEQLEAKLAARTAAIQQERRRNDAEMENFYAACDGETLRQILHEVHESVDHVDPVLLYVGDATFTNWGKYNNLQARNGADLPDCFFTRAAHMRLADWSEAERALVFCLYWLRMAGCRGEEFNGRQLYPAAVDAYLDSRVRDYRAHAPWLGNESAASIADKAQLLARFRRETASALLTYRWINGLNFYKEERLVERDKLHADITAIPDAIPDAIRERLAMAYGIDVTRWDRLDRLFDACIARMAENGFACDAPDMNAFEELLQVIVDSAIEATGSDVGMTRGFRDLLRWQQAFAAHAYEEICGWQPGEHYCAVFPSKALLAHLKHNPDALTKVLYACSGRMQFNSWHYTPGHCPRDRVPADRHFYLPPRMADTAVWSDQHHAGHVHAQVRNTIRCPEPIVMDGRVYAGLVDLRLFRQRGHVYTDDELFLAMRYSNLLRAACQALADYQSRTGRAVPVKAFDKDWFRQHYAALCLATPRPDGKPAQSAPAPVARPAPALLHILCRHAQLEQVALVEARHGLPETQVSYRALVMQLLAFRAALARHRIATGACVTVWSERPLHQVVAILAGLANGVTIHPVNAGLSAAMLEGQLRHAQPALLVVDDDAATPDGVDASVFQATVRVRWSEAFEGRPAAGDASEMAAALAAADRMADGLAGLLIYTSGTTGEPKGVRLGWPEIHANVRHAIDALGYQPGWVAGSLLPRFHTFTLISDLLPALLVGGRAVLTDTFDIRHLESIVDAFRRHGVQSYSAAPIVFEACCGLHAWRDVPTLRFAVAGAAPLKERTRLAYGDLFGHPIVPCYGLTETTCFAAISPPEAIRAGAVGRAAGIELCVMDEHGRPLPHGATGELVMRGPSVIRHRYFRDHENRFARSFHDEGWFLSGDIGHVDQDGYVYVTGRKKNMMIRGGEKIYLDDLDRCLFDAPGIVDCASVVQCRPGEPDTAWTFIASADGQPISRAQIEAAICKTLTPRHVPDYIRFIERIPRTPSGKASHRELLALAGNAVIYAVAP